MFGKGQIFYPAVGVLDAQNIIAQRKFVQIQFRFAYNGNGFHGEFLHDVDLAPAAVKHLVVYRNKLIGHSQFCEGTVLRDIEFRRPCFRPSPGNTDGSFIHTFP